MSSQKKLQIDKNAIAITSGGETYHFSPKFTVIYSENDPKMVMRPAGIENINYNVATWIAYKSDYADLRRVKRDDSQTGDGFDDRILEGDSKKRTPNYFNSGKIIELEAIESLSRNDTLFWEFAEHDFFSLEAYVVQDDTSTPKLTYKISPKVDGYFSVGYSGAPSFSLDKTNEIWQPFIWQEKRFPDNSYLTLAFRAPIPSTFINDGSNTIGVLASPNEFPFNPMPTKENSRFGILVRNNEGKAQPQLFAPVLGGIESRMDKGTSYNFETYFIVDNQELTYTYEKLARKFFGFGDYRTNAISSLNKTFENILEYGNSKYGRYVDSLKGYEYSTDVTGAVKNVSSLNPLELSIVTDDEEMFNRKAYPMMEYMLSREKFLFSLDPNQRIQSPSRKLNGPTAPISELTSLYNIFNKKNPFLLDMAFEEYKTTKIRNLDVAEKGETWINAMFLYKASGDTKYLVAAKAGADEYLKNRVLQKQTDFKDPFGRGLFFWIAYTNRWIELLELYEITKEEKYLQAARDGARHYTQFTWMAPKIPDTLVTVNEGGKAPMYWYLKSKGHKQMYYPEEKVPAWRLSEIGLTPESTGTSTGHRGIFMANYAPWMLRIGHYTNDKFLKEVAKAAIIGRYRNFPGYHINTARTTAYEKEDYPLHEHLELSVNSFHYNHILPMASMLLDYMITDTWSKSDEKINFPSEYIEGYAYLINKFYGHEKGTFYDEKDVQLWMPKDLLKLDNVELNYISARKKNQVFIAFTNQSNEHQKAVVHINEDLVSFNKGVVEAQIWINNKPFKTIKDLKPSFEIEIEANGITAIAIKGVEPRISFQDSILKESEMIPNSYMKLGFGNGRAMLFKLGSYAKKAYIYLQDDDSVFKTVTLEYTNAKGKESVIKNTDYPFEFTIPLGENQNTLKFKLKGITVSGELKESNVLVLGNNP
ncbi:MAG: hypothetical protein GZ086_02760 [Gelidibacter sp.]|nr:hypothetical protein [Gelidibacter sp.]